MAIYPPNQTTPAKGSGNYVWNWLGSSLKKFAAALQPYLGGGDSRLYAEYDLSSAQILSLSSNPVELLPALTGDKYYVVNECILEYTGGTNGYTPFNPDDTIYLTGMNFLMNSLINSTGSKRFASNSSYNWSTIPSYTVSNGNGIADNVRITADNDPTGGDGTLKVKLWYTIHNFG